MQMHFSAPISSNYTYVQMLTDVDRYRLALRASRKYSVNVSDEQIINLMFDAFFSANKQHLLKIS